MIDSLALSLKFNPGTNTILRMLGVAPSSDANVEMMGALHRLRNMNPILQQGFGGQLGISPQALMTLMAPHALEDIEAAGKDVARRQDAAGLNSGRLGYDSKVFMNDLRKLEDEFGILGAKITQDSRRCWRIAVSRYVFSFFLLSPVGNLPRVARPAARGFCYSRGIRQPINRPPGDSAESASFYRNGRRFRGGERYNGRRRSPQPAPNRLPDRSLNKSVRQPSDRCRRD
jgi:hypothetical protein